jgi:hypothetical protein
MNHPCSRIRKIGGIQTSSEAWKQGNFDVVGNKIGRLRNLRLPNVSS